METGGPGVDGPRVQRLAGSASSQEADHVPIQLLRMAVGPAQGPLHNRHLVIPHHAKVNATWWYFGFRCSWMILMGFYSLAGNSRGTVRGKSFAQGYNTMMSVRAQIGTV